MFSLCLILPSHSKRGAKTTVDVSLATLLARCGVENKLGPCAHATARHKCRAPKQMAAETVARNMRCGAVRYGRHPNVPYTTPLINIWSISFSWSVLVHFKVCSSFIFSLLHLGINLKWQLMHSTYSILLYLFL